MKQLLALSLCVACAGSATSTSTQTTERIDDEGGEEAVVVVVANENPRALFAAQQAALETQDAAAFVQDFESDAVFLGPVADAVYLGRDAIASALGDVVEASGTLTLSSDERHFATQGAVAWSVHDVRIAPTEEPSQPPMLLRVSSVYRRSEDGWQLAAQAWGAVVANARYAELNANAGTPVGITARADAACAASTAELQAWLGGDAAIWRDNPEVFVAGIDPGELYATTENLASAGDALAVQPGAGGLRALDLGEGICVVVGNQIVDNRVEGAEPRGALPYRMLALFRGDALRLAHVLAVVPDAPPLPESDGDADADADADSESEGEAEPEADSDAVSDSEGE